VSRIPTVAARPVEDAATSHFDGSLALATQPSYPAARRPPRLVVVADPPTTVPEIPPPPVKVLLRGVLEVLSGRRPASQLILRTSPEIAQDLLTRPSRRSSLPAQVERVRVLRVADRAVETCAVIRRPDAGGRCGALAMRVEYSDERGWVVTRLQVG
jgi:hypothetical protein